MALGPGKYDELATLARVFAEARGVVLIVLDGKHGSGFSAQLESPEHAKRLPALLRELADGIEADTA